MDPVYELQSVSKIFGNVHALDDINLTINTGEVTGFIGRSGAGKTTMLKMLAGLEPPTAGKLLYRGTEIDGKSAARLRRSVTLLFQTPLFLRGDAYTNVSYGLRIRGLPESDTGSLVSEALKTVRMSGCEKRSARSLSGGEQQRIALARALVINPEVLLLDEPTSNLDPENTSIISDIIDEEGKNRCVVVATHDYSQIRRLTDRVIFLENGRAVEAGATEDVLSGYQVARMENVFSGDARIEEGLATVDIGGGVEIKTWFSREGRLSIQIDPEHIIISKDWIKTSARNEFKGQVTSLEEIGPLVKLKLDAGRSFTVQITRKSFNEMGLNIGSEVYLSFKASSVKII